MNRQIKKFAIPGLRYALGVVVLLESIHFALSHSTIHQLTRMGLPRWIGPALGGSEALAALLFLVPAATAVGGCALLVIFAIAVGIHWLHGEADVGGLIVYAAAVIVCLTHGETHDR